MIKQQSCENVPPVLEIVESEIRHAKELSLTMRHKDKIEAKALGLDPTRGVFYAYRHAVIKRTGLVDGKVGAMWGVHGEFLSNTGRPYLITSPEVLRMSPIRFAKIYKREAQEMLSVFPILENYVDASYEEAVRLLQLVGFDITEEVDMNDNKFKKFRMVS